ncbi:Shedu immune nuclease family protein [Achromobacter xylosoxidans]|uniref:Shedu immune nuclease family protein n=1 Tax=Alcaligenes xylosoxydans xylosoxydans TaxID=85698 RepID=UPI0006C52684|nr:Shedu immune nuclease family protein [Achromobacter xylosoxidans]CUI57944.1 Uncharacterised protein [Achromobacter xylosoxidans]
MVAFEQSLIDNFELVLANPAPPGRQKEQVVQDFLENHSALIPTPNLLHHGLHFELILSKFPISTELITDYVYITKSSDTWRITLVELESPDKKIFTNNLKGATLSAAFNAALAQVRSWKIFLANDKQELIRRLKPLLQPLGMSGNPIEFNYQLIIGRSAEKNLAADRKKIFREVINESGIEIMTYDQIIARYKTDRRHEKLVARISGSQFWLSHMPFSPNQILAYLGPADLKLTQEQIDHLNADGYEMDKWKGGELLTLNWKYAPSSDDFDPLGGLIKS